MKERIVLLSWILFVAIGIYMMAVIQRPQQYDYNGWVLKAVYAAVAPDTNSVYTWSPEWTKWITDITVNISQETVNPTQVRSVYVPPPPRDSH